MYIENAFFALTNTTWNGIYAFSEFNFNQLSTKDTGDGKVLFRDYRGVVVGKYKGNKPKNKLYLILGYSQEVCSVETQGCIKLDDEVLSERIIHYVLNHYQKQKTNCAVFARFLATGNFVECDQEKSGFMFSGGFNRYAGQKIQSGDIVGMLYYSRHAKSRKAKYIREHYREVIKNKNRDLSNLTGVKSFYSSESLLEAYRTGFYNDYHFMYCIGNKNGKPIFIQQMGKDIPSSEEGKISPIIVSVGMTNMTQDIPALVFVKKGRR